jgi:hypothetical protein
LQPQPQTTSQLLNLLAVENFLLDAGLITEISADTLMGYGYMQPGIAKVTLEIDTDEKGAGKNPFVVYKLELEPKFGRRYKAMYDAQAKGGLWGKLKMIWLLKRGIPMPGMLESNVEKFAQDYLPKKYKVFVNVVKW